jgi:hypothetical protein
MRARLLAVQAEALLAAGRTGEATAAVLQGSALVTPNEAGEDHVAAAELAWALGLLERRRGDRAAAHRSWVRCLERLDMLPSAEPSWPLLGARTQIELAALHEIDGALETAQHFLSRAAATLARLADPAMAAHDALAAGDALAAAGDAGRAIEVPVSPASALALAVVVAASRLAMQVGRDLARLERVASRWPAALAPVEVSHSRHLR